MNSERIGKLMDTVVDEIESSIGADEMEKRNAYRSLIYYLDDKRYECCAKCRKDPLDCPQRSHSTCTKEYRQKHE